jgi:hypothetical protein
VQLRARSNPRWWRRQLLAVPSRDPASLSCAPAGRTAGAAARAVRRCTVRAGGFDLGRVTIVTTGVPGTQRFFLSWRKVACEPNNAALFQQVSKPLVRNGSHCEPKRVPQTPGHRSCRLSKRTPAWTQKARFVRLMFWNAQSCSPTQASDLRRPGSGRRHGRYPILNRNIGRFF